MAGSVAEGVTVSMDIEQLIYEAGTDGRHTQTIMTFTRRLSNVKTIQQQDSAERAVNKLARTFVSQMEALKRYRTGGEQKVTVQHVSVSEGGQAIVGNVTQGSREAAPSSASPPPAIAHSKTPAMRMVDESEPMTVPTKRKPTK